MGNSLRGIVKVDLVIKEKHARLNNDSCFQVLSNKKKTGWKREQNVREHAAWHRQSQFGRAINSSLWRLQPATKRKMFRPFTQEIFLNVSEYIQIDRKHQFILANDASDFCLKSFFKWRREIYCPGCQPLHLKVATSSLGTEFPTNNGDLK